MHDLSTLEPGSVVKISLRGPCSETELAETKRIHEEAYPHLNFEFTWDENPIEIEVVHGNPNDS